MVDDDEMVLRTAAETVRISVTTCSQPITDARPSGLKGSHKIDLLFSIS